MTTTARDFITLAAKEAGVLGVGQTLLAEDTNDIFVLLHRMLKQWQKKRWLVPSLYEVIAQANGARSNLIGPGQFYNAPRPDKIQAAYFKQIMNVGGGGFSSGFSSGFGISSPNSNDVSFPLTPIWSYEDYSLVSLKGLTSWPSYFFYDNAFPFGNVYIWPIPDSTYEIHLICKSPIGFTIQIEAGNLTAGGTLYTDGTYNNATFTNLTGFGSGAQATVTILGGIVTNVVITDGGDGYNINDQLTINPNSVGGTGGDAIFTVTDVTDSLDAIFNMPEEYEEAIHYNLAIRIASMYKYAVEPVTAGLAKLSLNTIKVANTQVPTLQMPSSLRFGKNASGSFYIFNADAR
jgi:hypothetical protein